MIYDMNYYFFGRSVREQTTNDVVHAWLMFKSSEAEHSVHSSSPGKTQRQPWPAQFQSSFGIKFNFKV